MLFADRFSATLRIMRATGVRLPADDEQVMLADLFRVAVTVGVDAGDLFGFDRSVGVDL